MMGGYVAGRNESLGPNADRGQVSPAQINKYNKVIHYGEVLRVSDDGNMKLKVYINGIDKKDAKTAGHAFIDNTKDPDYMPWCEPLLPRMFSVCPTTEETVKIILQDTKNPYIEREWIGPIISQPEKIKKDPYLFTGLAGKVGGFLKLGRSIKTIPDSDGIYPGPDDVSLLGRENSDIRLRENEVLIRAGQHILDSPLVLNKKNPAYISLRVLRPSDLNNGTTVGPTEDRTDTLIVSNKIFLVGRDSNSPTVPAILTKSDQVNLEEKLHPIVYGDVLYDFMVILREWMKNHIHIGPEKGVDKSGSSVQIEEWFTKNLEGRLLSKNVFAGGDVEVGPKRTPPSIT